MIKNRSGLRRMTGKLATGMLVLLGAMILNSVVQAQEDIRLRFIRPAPLRLTVAVNSTSTGTITNFVNLSSNIVGGVTLSVSNLPAGCGYDLVTTNGSAGLSVTFTNDQPLSIVVNSTNLPQGEYTFYLTGTGGATNRFPFVIQSAYVWSGAGTNLAFYTNSLSNPLFNWTNAASWVGGSAPGTNSANDVVFGTLGAQTNRTADGLLQTNINITQSITVGSVRFGQGVYTNTETTNTLYNHVLIAANSTVAVTGSKGFNFFRDYLNEYEAIPRAPHTHISGGGNGARLLVSNATANVTLALDVGNNSDNVLCMTNLQTFEAWVSRVGLGDYQLYPNYREMNVDTNGLGGLPRRLVTTVILARTNFITATYKDPNNYANDQSRSYAFSWLNSEMSGANQRCDLFFGFTNRINADAVCFGGGNHNSVGAAAFRAGQNNNGAIFRSAGGGRMSLISVGDGGGTNDAASNVKGFVNFWGGQSGNFIDILVTNLYLGRDRGSIAESNTVNYTGSFIMGKGTVDVNNAILGYQEHQVRMNNDIQLGYCQGTLIVTNGGLFKVNNQLTLGYTADTNDVIKAQQYNTWGRVTVDGATLVANSIVVDGGPRNYSHMEGTDRSDSIRLTAANLTVTNSIGNSPGQPLNLFSSERSTNTFFVNTSRTNLVCRQLATPGTEASIIRVASLTGVSSYPATVPIIKYEVANSPFLKADVTPVTNSVPGLNGYLLNNTADFANKTIDLYLTTNAPRTLLWTGTPANSDWDTNTLNWIPIGGGAPTRFAIGDIAVFDDTATGTNVNITVDVVPGQTGAGVIVSNSVRQYTFSGSGIVAGTSLMLKVGTEKLTISNTKQGPITVLSGPFEVGAGGNVGLVTLASNVTLNVIGTINGGLTSTGAVTVALGGLIAGPTTLAAGSLDNSGNVVTAPGGFNLDPINPITIINQASGILMPGGPLGTQWTLNSNSVLANLGTISNQVGRLNLYGFMYGNGSVLDPDGTSGAANGVGSGVDGRLEIRNPTGVLSPGVTASNSIGTITVGNRFDFDGVNGAGWGTLLIEVDKSNSATNDSIAVDYWSNIQGKIALRNINPSLPFAAGDFFRVLINNNSPGDPYGYFNQPDNTIGDHPVIEPVVPGPGLQWDLTDFRNYGVIKVKASPLIWNGNLGSTWDAAPANVNWKGGLAYTNFAGAVFDESATLKSVVVSAVVAPGGYSLSTNIVVGVSTNMSTNSVGFSPGIIVSNSTTYTFSATGTNTIEGMTGLYKTGSGVLDLGTMSNRFTGPVILDQGTISVAVYTNNGAPSPLGAPGLTPDNRAPSTSERMIVGNGATIRFTGLSTNTADRAMTIVSGGAVFEVANAASHLLLGGTFRGDGGALTKTGPGTVTFSSTANSMTNLIVNNGMVRFANSAAGAGHVIVNGGSLGFTNNTSITNLINFTVNSAIDNTNRTVLGGSFVGSGNVSITNNAPSLLAWTRDLTNYTGTLTFVGNGTNWFNNATNNNNALGSAAALFDLGPSARLENFNGGATNGGGAPLTYDLGGLAGGAGSSLAGRATNNGVAHGTSIYSIGAKGVDTIFAGTILDGVSGGTVSVVKVGSARLALNGASTYTGNTTVSNGTLGGTGSIVSPLTVASGGTLAPGSSGVGTFTVSNTVALGGTTLMELNGSTSDLLRATGTITAGGTLTVTNTGGTLVNGTVFTLFSSPVAGSFAATNLPAGYTWAVNLGTSGSITVLTGGTPGVNTTPTNITSSLVGSTLTLSWPSDRIGWTLQTQTNALSVGLNVATNAWFGVAGSSTTNSVSITIDPTKPTVFYRLVYP